MEPSQAPPSSSGSSSSDDTIRSILEQARREMEAQQAALEPVLKASSLSPGDLSLLSPKLLGVSPPYSPLALSLKKPPPTAASSSSPSPLLDFSTMKKENAEPPVPEATSEGGGRQGRSSGAGPWRDQWWSTMHPERRGMTPLQSEDSRGQEDSKEVGATPVASIAAPANVCSAKPSDCSRFPFTA